MSKRSRSQSSERKQVVSGAIAFSVCTCRAIPCLLRTAPCQDMQPGAVPCHAMPWTAQTYCSCEPRTARTVKMQTEPNRTEPNRGRNCSPAPDLVFFKLIVPRFFFSGGVFFHRHRHHIPCIMYDMFKSYEYTCFSRLLVGNTNNTIPITIHILLLLIIQILLLILIIIIQILLLTIVPIFF